MDLSNRQARRRRAVPAADFLDDQQQDSMIEKFTTQAQAQARLYRAVFAIVLVLPSPTYIFARHCRHHPKMAFLSLVSLMLSVYTLRHTTARANSLRKLNIALAAVIAIQAGLTFARAWGLADAIWLFPLVASVTAWLLERWMTEVEVEITRLGRKKYDLRGA